VWLLLQEGAGWKRRQGAAWALGLQLQLHQYSLQLWLAVRLPSSAPVQVAAAVVVMVGVLLQKV
jgi:hypothetical protein